jgi:hypothetical protein
MDPQINLDGNIFHTTCAKCEDCRCQVCSLPLMQPVITNRLQSRTSPEAGPLCYVRRIILKDLMSKEIIWVVRNFHKKVHVEIQLLLHLLHQVHKQIQLPLLLLPHQV